MSAVSAVPERTGRGARRPKRAVSWPLVALALVLALALGSSSVWAEEKEKTCEDYTWQNRPCTAMEEYGFCLTNAVESFNDCVDGAGLIGKIGCGIAFDVDYVACTAALPLEVVKSAIS